MFKRIIPLVLAIAVMGTAACSNERRETTGGGGGGKTAVHDETNKGAGVQNTWWDQASANLSNDLSTEGRDFAEAYTRAPWVVSNLAANDWERALDDLQFINDQLDDLNKDNDVSSTIKAKISTLKPMVHTLNAQIQKHDKAAIQTASKLVGAFTLVVNDKAVLAWMGDKTRGGGAGKAK